MRRQTTGAVAGFATSDIGRGLAESTPRRIAEPAFNRPIFLHGMWRSGSTYVWSKFRAAPDTLCYFEPLIEGLARLTPTRIARDTPEVVAGNRHPRLEEPYFAEFAPLIGLRGVRDYRRHFATRRFVLGEDDSHPALKRYIARLIRHAENYDRTPVFGFNRTVMRLPWLCANFDAYHVQIDRDPFDIWASYTERMSAGDYTFLTRWLLLVEQNRHFPPFATLADRLPIRRSLVRHLTRPKPHYRAVLQELSAEATYTLVFVVWLAAALQALTYADLILDVNKADAAYVADRAGRVHKATRVDVDFEDLQQIGPATHLAPKAHLVLERNALALFPKDAFAAYYDPVVVRARLGELTPRKADLLARLL